MSSFVQVCELVSFPLVREPRLPINEELSKSVWQKKKIPKLKNKQTKKKSPLIDIDKRKGLPEGEGVQR